MTNPMQPYDDGYQDGRDFERERIIKLLEARILTSPQPTDLIGSISHAGHNQLLRSFIALIKGEYK